ncbi:hypothetical protein ABEB36_012744 [Hypothenemus hampei]|uniref:Peptidase A2 domain-containing protein n=1 Tax=Hypothenemus hampei TaxID=57062 RepID=A0ABD1ECE0_HYPHA
MASANTTMGEALRQVIDPATPKFIQPPIFRPAVDSPSSFLLGYERAAIGNGWTDKYKILYLGQFLEGPAHKWYQEYLGNEENNENNWSTIKKDFKTEFLEGQQHEMASSNFYRKKQGYTKDIKQYYYELLGLADEVDLNMPFKDFLTQFEKGLHPRFRQLYYIMREDNMNRGILKNIVQKLHRSQESLVEKSYPSASVSNYHPQANGQYNADSRPREPKRDWTASVDGPQEVVLHSSVSKILSVKGLINSKYMDIVLDTGAGRSIIREDMVTSVDSLTNKVNLVGAGGSRLLVTGTHAANIEFGSVKISATLLVARHLSRSVILGNDFLDATLAIINYRNRTINLEVEGKEIEFPFTRIGTRYSIQKPKSSDSHKRQVKPSSIQRPTPIFPIDIGEKETKMGRGN